MVPKQRAVRLLTHRVCDAGGRPAEHEDGHRDEHDQRRAALLLLKGPALGRTIRALNAANKSNEECHP